MNATVGRKKAKPDSAAKGEQRSEHYPIFVRIKPDIGKALDDYLHASNPEVTTKAAIEAALRDFLTKHGHWPPSEE